MDTLYIGDIPQEYHFARFGSNYIDLYNTSVLTGTKDYYRVYMYDNCFMYDYGTTTYNYQTYYATEILVTNNVFYRRDIDSITIVCFALVILGLWLSNLVTSIIKKGGLLGGLF